MTFKDWMHYRGLSPSSVKKYDGAVRGVMSEWAMKSRLINGPLTSLTSHSTFKMVAEKIRNLPIYVDRNRRGHNMYNAALEKFSEYLAEGYENDEEADIDAILADDDISETERVSLIKSRIGQGIFRQKLVYYWKVCAVTGFKDPKLLVASHIKPWRASSHSERLDPFNGLLLTPNLDRAFDAGYITFTADGSIKISPQLAEPEKIGVSANMRISLTTEHEKFLSFHRNQVFRTN